MQGPSIRGRVKTESKKGEIVGKRMRVTFESDLESDLLLRVSASLRQLPRKQAREVTTWALLSR